MFLPAPFDNRPYWIGESGCVREVGLFMPGPGHDPHDHCIRSNVVKCQLSGEDLSKIRTTSWLKDVINVAYLVY